MRGNIVLVFALAALMSWQVCEAKPFDEISDTETIVALQQLESAHLLGSLTVPEGPLTRLEAALLVQTALRDYVAVSLAGAPDAETEAMLGQLAEEYREELVLLGSTMAAPTVAAEAGDPALAERVAKLEAQLAERAKPAEEPASDSAACAKEDDIPISTSFYGNVYLQTRYRQTDITPGDDENFSDVDIYWGELGIDTRYDDWSGHFSVLLDDASGNVLTNEAWATYRNIGECGPSPWYFQLGRIMVPFGNNPYYFPTYPAVNDLGYSTLHAVGGGYGSPSNGISAYVYNSRAEVVGEDDSLKDFTATVDIAKREADECRDGYELSVGYNSHLGSHDIRLAGSDVEKRVPGINLYGKYDFNNHGDMVHVLADYTYATEEFDPADLDANGDTVGDKPTALNAELIFEPQPDTIYGISVQKTTEFKDYAETRWGLVYGERLNKLAKFKLEYTHGEFGEFATGGQQSDDTFVGEINISF